MMLNESVTVSPDVVARQVGTEMVLLDLPSGTYFGLDAVGARIWTLMGEGQALNRICDQLVESYEAERTVIERDVLELADALRARRLLASA